jgi:hypothetical protein
MEDKIFLTEEELKECEIEIPFTRILSKNDRKLPYRSRKFEYRKALYWEQRKLLMSEIEFLTKYGDKNKKILYIGAAPGSHLGILCPMFPDYHFILYDPVQFDPVVETIENAEIHNCLFEDGCAELYKNQDILFISDISKETDGQKVYDDVEEEYMINQQKWHLLLNPTASLLKFQLPYDEGITEYLKGDIYYQIWAPATSTESRIVVVGNEMDTYDHKEYESIMFRFNICTRFQPFETQIRVGAFQHSYDIKGELEILSNYLSAKKVENMSESLLELENKLTDFFGKSIDQKYEDIKKLFNKRLEKVLKNSLPKPKPIPKPGPSTFKRFSPRGRGCGKKIYHNRYNL